MGAEEGGAVGYFQFSFGAESSDIDDVKSSPSEGNHSKFNELAGDRGEGCAGNRGEGCTILNPFAGLAQAQNVNTEKTVYG
jgi:hypothetical protein